MAKTNVVRKPMPKGKDKEVEKKVEDIIEEKKDEVQVLTEEKTIISDSADDILGEYLLSPVINANAGNDVVDPDMIEAAKMLWRSSDLYFHVSGYAITLRCNTRTNDSDILEILSKYANMSQDEMKTMFGSLNVKELTKYFPEFNKVMNHLDSWESCAKGLDVSLETIALQPTMPHVEDRLLMASIIFDDDRNDKISRRYDQSTENPADWENRTKKECYTLLALPEDALVNAAFYHKFNDLGAFMFRFINTKMNLFKGSNNTKKPDFTANNKREGLEDVMSDPKKIDALKAISEELLLDDMTTLLDQSSNNRDTEPYSREELEKLAHLLVHNLRIKPLGNNFDGCDYSVIVDNKSAISYLSSFAENPDGAKAFLEKDSLFQEDKWSTKYLNHLKMFNHYITQDNVCIGDLTLPSNMRTRLLIIDPSYRPIVAAVVKKTLDAGDDEIREKHIFPILKEYGIKESAIEDVLAEIKKVRD